MENQFRPKKNMKEEQGFNNPFKESPMSPEIGESADPQIDPHARWGEHDLANDFESTDKTA